MLHKNLLRIPVIIAALLLAANTTAQKTNRDVHLKYGGNIVFAEEKINFENIDDGILKDRFGMLSTIYGRIFMEKPLQDYYDEYGWSYSYQDADLNYNFSTNIYIDGQKAIKWLDELDPMAFGHSTYLDLVIAPKEKDKLEYSMLSHDWVESISRLDEGIHSVKVEMRAESMDFSGTEADPVATGEFRIKVENSMRDEFRKKYAVKLPDPTIIDDDIVGEILAASLNMWPTMTPIMAYIIEPTGQWQYDYDMTGAITSRNFIAAVALKSLEGNCYIRSARFFQDHHGYFEFDNVRLAEKLPGYMDYRIPCDLIE